MPSRDTQFKPGWKGGPGKPKGAVSGRKKALQALDMVLAEPAVQENLTKLFRDALSGRQGLGAWKKIVEPLLPKDMRLEISPVDLTGKIEIYLPSNTRRNGEGNGDDNGD